MATTAAPAPQAPASLGTFGRLTGALFSPRATFEDIAHRPGWIAPVILLCAFAIAITAIFSQRVGWRGFIAKQLENSKAAAQQMEQMTPEQREQFIDQRAKLAPIFGYIFAPVGIVVVVLLTAGVLLGVFNGLASADLNYKTSLGIVTHAWMPAVVAQILGIIVLFLKPPDMVDLQNLVASNLGAAVSADAPRWLQTLATSIDLFSFWIIFLLALGFSAARPKKVSFGRALSFVLILWAVVVLIHVGVVAAFS